MEKIMARISALLVVCSLILCLAPNSYGQSEEALKFAPDASIEELRYVIEHNGYDFAVDHNWVYDMPAEMKKDFFSRRPPRDPKGADISPGIGPLERQLGKALPAAFDWRNHNGHSYIGPVRDQLSCGSCYAFGAAAAAEGTYNVANDLYDASRVDFSESFIIWCLGRIPLYYWHFYGCDGADYDYYELQALVDYGIVSEADFPYTIIDPGSCTHATDPRVVFESWHRIPCNDVDAIKTAIMTYGVVDAAVWVDSAFQAYSSGVYEDTNILCSSSPCYYTPTNHAIALVGWDDAGDPVNNGYWILRNSWGPTWGEGGYMRIKYNSAFVSCEACYLVYESQAPTPDIKVNGEDGPLAIAPGGSATITVALDPGDMDGQPADVWIGIATPFGIYWLFDHTIALFNLSETTLASVPLPAAGSYTFFFVIDDNPNGSIAVTWYDYVAVTCQTTTGAMEASPDDDTAFLEKLDKLIE